MSEVATLICIAGILGLFYMTREPSSRYSPALWIPAFWLLIIGSRPVSVWLDMSPEKSAAGYMDGSPLDRNVFLGLLIVGLCVLIGRQKSVARLLSLNPWIVVFLAYCGASILWSDFPDVAAKRWIKFLGDHVMVLIVLTDTNPLAALKRIFARVGFVLLPLSVLFIKYYPALGRAYAPHWTGAQYFTGVTTDKNMLGVTCLVFGMGASWQFIQEFAGARRARILLAQGVIVGMTLWLLLTCDSMTSLSCFIIGTGLIAATTLSKFGKRRRSVHLMVAGSLLVCSAPLFLGVGGGVLSSMGRNSTLSGRTQLWSDVLGMAANPLLGTGFESFWLGPRLEHLWSLYWWQPIESHNGYIEVYLNLGLIGLALLVLMVLSAYRNVSQVKLSEMGPLRVAFFVAGLAYNSTEAAIHTTNLIWVFFMLSIFAMPKSFSGRASLVANQDEETQQNTHRFMPASA